MDSLDSGDGSGSGFGFGDGFVKLKNLTDEQIERLADAVDKVTPEEATRWANLERVIMGRSHEESVE